MATRVGPKMMVLPCEPCGGGIVYAAENRREGLYAWTLHRTLCHEGLGPAKMDYLLERLSAVSTYQESENEIWLITPEKILDLPPEEGLGSLLVALASPIGPRGRSPA